MCMFGQDFRLIHEFESTAIDSLTSQNIQRFNLILRTLLSAMEQNRFDQFMAALNDRVNTQGELLAVTKIQPL